MNVKNLVLRSFLVAALMILSVAAACAADPLEQCVAFSKQGKLREAVAACTEAIKLNADDLKALTTRGNSYAKLEQFDKAAEDFTKIIRLKPDSWSAYARRGRIYCHSGKYDKAIDDYTLAINLKADHPTLYAARGYTYLLAKRYNNAIADYTKSITISSNDANTYGNRGIAYYRVQQYDKAIEDLSKASSLNADLAYIYYYRALSYDALGKTEESRNDIKAAHKYLPLDDSTTEEEKKEFASIEQKFGTYATSKSSFPEKMLLQEAPYKNIIGTYDAKEEGYVGELKLLAEGNKILISIETVNGSNLHTCGFGAECVIMGKKLVCKDDGDVLEAHILQGALEITQSPSSSCGLNASMNGIYIKK